MRYSRKGTALVIGGIGFVGSHLCEGLINRGHRVVCLDNLVTGRTQNVRHLLDHPDFTLLLADVTGEWEVTEPVDVVFHLASAASPVDYLRMPVETLEAGSLGTRNALRCVEEHRARFVLVSTSEVYGDPREHPQSEDYWGDVDPIGPRSVYDEAKRYAESLAMAHYRRYGTDVGIARVFTSYGPRMRPDDGRMVPTFIRQALAGEPITVAGGGHQRRSVCYVSDVVEGLLALADSDVTCPVNIGSEKEVSVLRLARLIRELSGTDSKIVFIERPEDDSSYRRPDITRAEKRLGWGPSVSLGEGLRRTLSSCLEEPALWAGDTYGGEGNRHAGDGAVPSLRRGGHA